MMFTFIPNGVTEITLLKYPMIGIVVENKTWTLITQIESNRLDVNRQQRIIQYNNISN